MNKKERTERRRKAAITAMLAKSKLLLAFRTGGIKKFGFVYSSSNAEGDIPGDGDNDIT